MNKLDFSFFRRKRLPFVGMSELNECGLACLACVSEFFGGEFRLADIRRLAGHSGRGESMLELRNIAERIGLSARAVRADVSALTKLQAPAILHWEMNHFVVLERATSQGIVIMDPATGRLVVSWSEVARAYTGVALQLHPSATWRAANFRRRPTSLRRLISPLSQWRPDAIVILLLSLLLEVLVLLVPVQLQLSVDGALIGADKSLVWVLTASFGLIVLLQGCVSVVRAWAISVFSTRVGYSLKDRFVSELHRKPATFFLKHHTSEIQSRSRSVDTIQSLISAQLVLALLDLAMSVALVMVVFVVVPVMGLVVGAFALINVMLVWVFRSAAIDLSRRGLRSAAMADSLFMENARAARAIRLFGKELLRVNLWRNKFIELTNITLADGRMAMLAMQASQFTNMFSNVVMTAVGTFMVLNGSLTLGTMMMLFLFRSFLVERLNGAVTYAMDLRRVWTNAERIEEVLTPPEGDVIGEVRQTFCLPPTTPVQIELRDVWFRYGLDTPWILKGVNLCVEEADSVAITGASGSGKSTLMHVMLGLLEPERGEVLINGRDLRAISSQDYAKIIAAVMQDDQLFNGTVAENIAFYDAPLDMPRVMDAAMQANIAADIERMPMQYYSVLAESASDISGGQKQRIFIARAIYHRPRILFLDEATSHLDATSERMVGQAIKALQLTRILIAHREETISTAGRILKLVDGTLHAHTD